MGGTAHQKYLVRDHEWMRPHPATGGVMLFIPHDFIRIDTLLNSSSNTFLLTCMYLFVF